MSFSLDPQLVDRLEVWINRQDLPPVKTHVVELALREFLDTREKVAAVLARGKR